MSNDSVTSDSCKVPVHFFHRLGLSEPLHVCCVRNGAIADLIFVANDACFATVLSTVVARNCAFVVLLVNPLNIFLLSFFIHVVEFLHS